MLSCCACAPNGGSTLKPPSSSYVLGGYAPELELTNAEGESARLSDYRGKVVFLNFWASWCMICEHEIPGLARLADTMVDEPFVVLAVSLDENREKFLKVAKKFEDDIELWHDQRRAAKKLFNSGTLPVTVLISREGRMVTFPDPNTGIGAAQFSGPKNWANPATLDLFRSLARG